MRGEPDDLTGQRRDEPWMAPLKAMVLTASVNAKAYIGPEYPEPSRVDWTLAPAPEIWLDGRQRTSTCAAPPPSLNLTGERSPFSLTYCVGRYEGTDMFLGRRNPSVSFLAIVVSTAIEPPIRVWRSHVQSALAYGNHVGTRGQEANHAGTK